MSYSHESVATALEDLRRMADVPDADGSLPSLLRFLEWLAALGRGRVVLPRDERERLLAESAPVLVKGLRHVLPYIFETLGIFMGTWYADEWTWACERRSRIEFLRTLYQGAISEDELDYWLDAEQLEELDDCLEERGKVEGGLTPDEIPAGTPPSHWWWWYPAQPPECATAREGRRGRP